MIFLGKERRYPIRTWSDVYQSRLRDVKTWIQEEMTKSGKTGIEILNDIGFNSIEEMVLSELIRGSKRTNEDATKYVLSNKK